MLFCISQRLFRQSVPHFSFFPCRLFLSHEWVRDEEERELTLTCRHFRMHGAENKVMKVRMIRMRDNVVGLWSVRMYLKDYVLMSPASEQFSRQSLERLKDSLT